MTKDQQSNRSQSELETIIRNGNFNSQSDANSYLQKHGLSCEMRDDGSAIIYDDQRNKVATVQLQGSGQGQKGISNVTF